SLMIPTKPSGSSVPNALSEWSVKFWPTAAHCLVPDLVPTTRQKVRYSRLSERRFAELDVGSQCVGLGDAKRVIVGGEHQAHAVELGASHEPGGFVGKHLYVEGGRVVGPDSATHIPQVCIARHLHPFRCDGPLWRERPG